MKIVELFEAREPNTKSWKFALDLARNVKPKFSSTAGHISIEVKKRKAGRVVKVRIVNPDDPKNGYLIGMYGDNPLQDYYKTNFFSGLHSDDQIQSSLLKKAAIKKRERPAQAKKFLEIAIDMAKKAGADSIGIEGKSKINHYGFDYVNIDRDIGDLSANFVTVEFMFKFGPGEPENVRDPGPSAA